MNLFQKPTICYLEKATISIVTGIRKYKIGKMDLITFFHRYKSCLDSRIATWILPNKQETFETESFNIFLTLQVSKFSMKKSYNPEMLQKVR